MKLFFPDHQDMVDPGFDFINEQHHPNRIRQRTDHYAHELFESPPYHGILLSKTAIDGFGGNSRYTFAQKQRFQREGIREFFRLDRPDGFTLESMGDCGAFSYFREEKPPFSVEELIQFYENNGFNYGCSLDHIILEYRPDNQLKKKSEGQPLSELHRRQQLTLELAEEFFRKVNAFRCHFIPIGVAQGWSPETYAESVRILQQIGYEWIAIGGIAYRTTPEILTCLETINQFRSPKTKLHLFGVSRWESLQEFARLGVASIDSTSPLKQAFKEDTDNYYTPHKKFTAIRIPQIQGCLKLHQKILSGMVDPDEAQKREQLCLQTVLKYSQGLANVSETLSALLHYEELHDGKHNHYEMYREVLELQPWKACHCPICKKIGIQVIIFRGLERNKRRGFHNLFVSFQQHMSNSIQV
ncbi:MAG: hypothetical protein HQM12_20645 [SAR324 cluster bacterium]|nr:hypothetical protein [SAR324 cluster bacterium]